MKLCSSCGQEKDNYEFSKTQWTKTTKERRCCICVSKSATNNFNLDPAPDMNNNSVTIPAGKSCFVSAGLEDHAHLDQEGNLVVDLDFLDLPSNSASREPTYTPMCDNPDCKKQDGSLSCCARCRCVSYCSKKCQTDDWRRHKRAECVSPPHNKHVLLEPSMAPEVYAETVQNTTSKMIDSMEDLVRSKQAGRTDDWKENITSKGLSFIEGYDRKDEIRTFVLKYYTKLASFAAVHIAKYPSMKGAVFLFSKICQDDLFDLPPDDPVCNHTRGPRKAYLLDRQFVMAWGCRYITGVEDHPHFTVHDLAGKFMDKVQTLPKSMDIACNQQSFPIVFCCDPSGSLIPDCFVDEIRGATHGQQFTGIMTTRFFDFEAMLEFGMKFPEMDINGLNMDRDYTNPSVR
jgi:hypothetical protein